jgi:KDO2-lipid IV(A) lauroyltransferase
MSGSEPGWWKRTRRKALNLVGERGFNSLQSTYLKKSAAEAERAGEALSMVWYAVDRKHRTRCMKNLAMAFPEWTEATCRSNAKETFRHFGRVAGDFLRSPVRTNQEVLQSVEVEGFDSWKEAISMGKGLLVLTGHMGNWERFAQWIVAHEGPLTVVARDADQVGVQDRVLRIRESVGVEVLSRGNTARHALVLLRKNKWVGLLADQNSKDCFVPFFGQPCGTVTGPAVLHRRTGAPIVPCYCVRTGCGRYKVFSLPIIDPQNDEEDAVALTAQINAALESVVREYPTQWLWMHDRWKSARRAGLLQEP